MSKNAAKILKQVDEQEPALRALKDDFKLLNQRHSPSAEHKTLDQESLAKLTVVTLWHELISCDDANRKQQLTDELVILLNLKRENDKLTETKFLSSPITWLKKQFGYELDMRVKLISLALDEQGYIIPAYNTQLLFIHNLIRNTLTIHQHRPSEDSRKLLYFLNQVRFDTPNPNLDKELFNFTPTTDPDLLKHTKSLKQYRESEIKYYSDLCLKIKYTFEQVLNHPYRNIVKKDPRIDLDTYYLLQGMVARIQGDHYIRALYRKFFCSNSYDFSKETLTALLDYLHTDFLDTQRIDFKSQVFKNSLNPDSANAPAPDLIDKFDIDEHRKQHSILKPWKNLLNYWSARKGLDKSLSRRSKISVLMDTCFDLDEQLQHLFTVYPHLNEVKKSHLKKKAQNLDNQLRKLYRRLRLIHLLKKYPHNSSDENDWVEKFSHLISTNPIIQDSLKKGRTKDRTLTEQHELYNFLEEEKKQLFFKLQDIRNELINTLDDTHLDYTVHEQHYKQSNTANLSYKKRDHYKKKQSTFWKFWKRFFLFSLAFGEASMSAYAFAVFFPLFGVFTLYAAPVLFSFVFISCWVLYSRATNSTIDLIRVKGDIWNGFTSPGGKLLMTLTWITSIFIALTLGALAHLSVYAILLGITGVLFPPALPIMLIAGHVLAGIITLGTIVCATSLYSYIIANNIKRFCDFLERLCPNIPVYGWGFMGLIKGIGDGLQSFHSRMQKTGGYWSNFKLLLEKEAEYYWTNPTGSPDAANKEMWKKRIEHLLGTVLKSLFILGALVLVVLGTWAILHAWHLEITEFLFGTLHLAHAASSLIAGVIVFSFTLVAESIFNLTNYLTFFDKLSQVTNQFINNYVVNYLFHPTEIVKDIKKSWNKFTYKTGVFFKNLKNDPVTTLFAATKKIINVVVLPFAVVCNALTTGFLIAKNKLIPPSELSVLLSPAGAGLVSPFSSLEPVEYLFAAGSAGVTGTGAAVETLEAICSEIPDHVPLVDARNILTICDSPKNEPLAWRKSPTAKYPYSPAPVVSSEYRADSFPRGEYPNYS